MTENYDARNASATFQCDTLVVKSIESIDSLAKHTPQAHSELHTMDQWNLYYYHPPENQHGNATEVQDYQTAYNMTNLWSLVTAYFSMAMAQKSFDIGRGIQKEIQAVKQPIDETIFSFGSQQCSNVKKIFGVAYEQIDGEHEPDLNQLTLKYTTASYNITYNITEAARLLPLDPEYRPDANLVIFIHGFTDDPTKDSFTNISRAFAVSDKYNLMALDGSSLIHWLYLRSTTYVRFMGEKLGEVLAAMVNGGMNPQLIHLVGHSLGSHIASFTGKTFQNLTGQKIGRISGLDPAGPCFSHMDPGLRLKEDDAEFVDVIHTDGGVYGLKDPVGQVDYYPNSGAEQPNCLLQTCSHSRAWMYFAESIVDPKAFPAVRCKDWDAFKKGDCEKKISYMGFPSKPGTTGLYYLQTGEDSPYGRYLKGTKYENNEGFVKNIGSILG